ncbi:DUF6515 family protein [Marinobacter sp. F3R11]|uniref:DUF6515 family protein n=1 Tax=Marinobacter sp. F3R11 TaxID=2267231 RepID=UPI000DEA026D|nr:DUF6515 family protein [Marinobacter sp. F3R11]RBW49811.1 hypothetical protein DS878_05615 [Marinobacter sp. F3R11]
MKQLIRYLAIVTVLSLSSLQPVQAASGRDPGVSRQEAILHPSRGAVVDRIPRGHKVYNYRGHSYHYHDGVWFRPLGNRFMVVAPPVGLVVPVLPRGAIILTIGGVPYYRYGDVYYRHEQDGYRVVEPPADATVVSNPASEELFVYPRDSQSAEQQASDRFECHEWASDQTGYDPTRDGGGVSEKVRAERRSDYLRAMTACLEARGYSVR